MSDDRPPPRPGATAAIGGGTSAGGGAPDENEAGAVQLARGQTIGRFVILALVGRGGMGEVYAAYDPELDRKVAVKVMRPRLSRSGDDRGRLLREAQAIAKLSHPNVVVVYDVGTIAERVFIAMEFVEGSTVGTWMRANRSRREILAVFLAAGRGLVAAHEAGMVHRDFKPDNVMIGKDGQVRVMDFGLARQVVLPAVADTQPAPAASAVSAPIPGPTDEMSTSGARYLSTKLTQTGVLTGSPAYMAPEQFLGGAVDARTDQFSFCVALYEALYGERPFAGETMLALQVSVVEGAIRPGPSQARVPKWIRRILLRGLSVDPRARFPSVAYLLAALGNDPARRLKKWALVVVPVAGIVAAAALTHVVGSHQSTMCTGAPTRLAGIWEPGPVSSERKVAIRRAFVGSGKSYADRAYASVSRLMDQYAGRWVSMYTEACEATHARGEQSADVLDLRMACLGERLGNVRALSEVFAAGGGDVVENAVSAAAALPSLDRCADVGLLKAVVKPPEDPATRKRVDDLKTELAGVIALRDSGQCARAIPRAEDLITKARAVNYRPLLSEALFAAAQLGDNCADHARALQRFKEAHSAAVASHNDELAAQASALIPSFALNRLSQDLVAREWLVVAQGNVARLGRETLADAMLAQAEGMLALTDKAYDRALAAADRSIEITRKLLGPDDPLTIQWISNKGLGLAIAGRFDEALRTDIQAREQFERLLGPDHPRVALVLNNQGEVLNLLGRYGEAEAAYRRSADLFRQSGADATFLGWALTGLGKARLGQRQPEAAIAPLQEALDVREQKQAPPPQIGETRFALARALWSRPDQHRRALDLATRARVDLVDDQKAVSEIDAWLEGAAPRRRLDR